MAKDHKVLKELSLERQTCTYKLKEGMSTLIHKRLVSDLKNFPFSINLDECTSTNKERVLSVLVSYFSEALGECVVMHYYSLSMTTVNAETVYKAVMNAFDEDDIPLTNLISTLSDSANYMRGKISGFETRLRETAPHLLDIDGDVCHHVHNSVKKFCNHFEGYIEKFSDDLYTDFQYSADLRDYIEEMCALLGRKATIPTQRIAHRWLSSYDVALRNRGMLIPLTIFYFAWLDKSAQTLYQSLYFDILKTMSKPARKRVIEISGILSKKNLTDLGLKRKKRIAEKLFDTRKTTILYMGLYCSILPMFKSFVLMFEQKEPMVHRLHDELTELFRLFLACFIKHEAIKDLNAKKLAGLDVEDSTKHLPTYQVYVGQEAEIQLHDMDKEEKTTFFTKVKEAYVDAGKYMQRTFPLGNTILHCMSALDPKAQGHSVTHSALKRLLRHFPTILEEEEEEEYLKEIGRIQVDPLLPGVEQFLRLDHWWAHTIPEYPVLGKVVKAALSIFTGPRIEQSFSAMNDIINPKTNRLKISTFAAIQDVKYHLKTQQKTSIELYTREDIHRSPVDKSMMFHLQTAYGRHTRKERARNEAKAAKEKSIGVAKNTEKVSRSKIPKPSHHSLAQIAMKRILAKNINYRSKRKTVRNPRKKLKV